jgi:hypothetical protein
MARVLFAGDLRIDAANGCAIQLRLKLEELDHVCGVTSRLERRNLI